MGYDIHITRAPDWTASEAFPISLEEWLDCAARDSEMRLDGFAEAWVGQSVLRVESEGLAVWTAYSRHEVGGNMAWFSFCYGRIVVKNPDDEILGKMRQIATRLQANVIGDEGETY
jgi:hypothetical protein